MDNPFRLSIISPGLQTSVQDHGREKFRAYGVPKAGPMDIRSAKLANQLVGNPDLNPVLEFTVKGPIIELVGQGMIAVTGGSFDAKLDHNLLPQNQGIRVSGKHTLSIGGVQTGCRGYLAVAGQWQLKPWLESCSTSPQNALRLTPDSLIVKGSTIDIYSQLLEITKIDIPAQPIATNAIRIMAGPEYHQIDTQSIKELLRKSFSISSQSNRMGYRLDSPISNPAPIEIISSGVVPGTIQLTDSGQLIVLMADAQTTGGYPRIANVLSKDLDILGQMKPGDRFKFKLVSIKEA